MNGPLLALLLAAAPTSWTQPTGAPAVTVVPMDGALAAVVVSFEFPPTHVATVASQAARALLRANAALPPRFELEVWAAGAQLRTASTQRELSLALIAPKAAFGALAQPLLTGLLAPRFDRARYQAITTHEAPVAEYASGEELLLAALEPYLNHERPGGDGLPRWTDAESMASFLTRDLAPANARVLLVGTDGKALERTLRRSAGAPRPRPAVEAPVLAEQTIQAAMASVIVGLPVPDGLSADDAAVLRVARLLMERRLTAALRDAGYAYTVTTSALFVPSFHGLLAVAPAFAGKGADLEPTVLRSLELGGEHAPTEAELAAARQAVLETTAALSTQPVPLVTGVLAGQVELGWLRPEHRQALEALTLERFASVAPRLVGDPKRRFVVRTVPFKETP